MPAFDVVGLPDAAVKESRERVRAAAKNAGFDFPDARLTVNLAPADQKKEGPAFDLPHGAGHPVPAWAMFPAQALEGMRVFGELSLDGSRPSACAARCRWSSRRWKRGVKRDSAARGQPQRGALRGGHRGCIRRCTPDAQAVRASHRQAAHRAARASALRFASARASGNRRRFSPRQGPDQRQARAGDRRSRRAQRAA